MQYTRTRINASRQFAIKGTISQVLTTKVEIHNGQIARKHRFRIAGNSKIYHSYDGAVEFTEGVEIEGILHQDAQIDVTYYKPLSSQGVH